jgi:L-xylulose reductase
VWTIIRLSFCMYVHAKAVARNMVKHAVRGSIVNMSSQASMRAIDNHTAYCASKGALDQLTRVMALELGPKQVCACRR